MEEEKREIKAPANKQLIMDRKKYTVKPYFKQGTRKLTRIKY